MPGVDELAFTLSAVAGRLREIGEGGLVRELTQEISDAVAPVPDRIRAGLDAHLPNRYAEVLDAGLRISRSVSPAVAGEETQVSVIASAGSRRSGQRKLAQLDNGILWHPLFGRFPYRDPRNRWFQNEPPSVTPGWFSDPVEESVPEVREAVERALDNVVAKAVGKGL
jgi:hypothetical protein